MPDVVVHRCTLHVVRRGGWSWGADPRQLLRSVIEAMPALVAAKLGELLADVPDGTEIAQPISIHIPVRPAELRTASLAGGSLSSDAGRRLTETLTGALDDAVRSVLVASARLEANERPAGRTLMPPARQGALQELLLTLRAGGLLESVLASAGEDAADAWLRAIEIVAASATSPREHRSSADGARDADVHERQEADLPVGSATLRLVELAQRLASSETLPSVRTCPPLQHVPRTVHLPSGSGRRSSPAAIRTRAMLCDRTIENTRDRR